MSRLTSEPFRRKLDDSSENYKVRRYGREEWETLAQNAINKLGRLEDIEEELGCPLVVVFKALKDGIVYEKENKYVLIPNLIFAQLLNEDVGDYHFINYDLPNLENNLIVKLSDYQKTWWLKGEEIGK